MFVIAIDPGKVKVGFALGAAGSRTPAVGTFTHRPGRGEDGYLLATRAATAFLNEAPVIGKGPVLICMELMQVDGRTAGKEENLLEVAMTGAAIVNHLACYVLDRGESVQIWSPTPFQWKRQLPKKVMHDRLKQSYVGLNLTKQGHDALDALGLFSWASTQLTLPVPFAGEESVIHADRR